MNLAQKIKENQRGNIHVVNQSKHVKTPTDYYIGRGSPLGNPYTSKEKKKTKAKFACFSRENSISLYEDYLRKEISNKNKVICDTLNQIYLATSKEDVYLVCFCKPKLCHGDVIKKILMEKNIKNPRDSLS
tara:strand:+ start:126688 stop:127080 length:393 start_codon:yes stop_codon:yes gene_type:complete